MDPKILKLIALNEQDKAECDVWWQNASEAEKIIVWNRIQEESADPVDDLVNRFAQLAFMEAAERNMVK